MKVTLTSAAKVSPIASLDFVLSIAPFIGVSSYALEIEHVFLPGREEKNKESAHDKCFESFFYLACGAWRQHSYWAGERIGYCVAGPLVAGEAAFAAKQESLERTSCCCLR